MPTLPIISLLHPTARVKASEGFPRGWRDVCEQFFQTCKRPQDVEYIIAVHTSRWYEFWSGAIRWDARLGVRRINFPDGAVHYIHFENWGEVKVVENKGRDCVVDQLNAAAAASTGEVLFGVMDDLRAPEHWDARILAALHEEQCQVLQVGTGSPRDSELIVSAAVLRSYYTALGYALHPDFESMYADNYFTWEAQSHGVLAKRLDIQFEHLHPSLGKGKMDEVYADQNSPAKYLSGRKTLARLTGQPMQKAIAICLPGEEFRSEWVHAWTGLFGHLIGTHGMMALPFFCHTTNVYCTRIELTKGVLEVPVEVDYVLWIDDDNTLLPQQFDMLMKDLEEHPELSGVVGWCWCDNKQAEAGSLNSWVMSCGRQGPNMQCYRFTPEELASQTSPLIGTDQMPKGDRFWSGFPVVLMRRSALEVLQPTAFAPIFRPDVNYGFTGEDTAFFWRAHEAGLKFAVDLRVKVPHIKWRQIEPVVWPQQIQESLKPAEGVTAGA